MPTAGELKRRFHRRVQDYAAEMASPMWGLSRDPEWGHGNLQDAERLAQHILDLPDDDARLAVVAEAYTARGWGTDRFPTADLRFWLVNFGASASGFPTDPDGFVTKYLEAEQHAARA